MVKTRSLFAEREEANRARNSLEDLKIFVMGYRCKFDASS